MNAPARELLSRVARSAWAVPERVPCCAWSDEHRRVIKSPGDAPTRYDSAATPYVREILDAWGVGPLGPPWRPEGTGHQASGTRGGAPPRGGGGDHTSRPEGRDRDQSSPPEGGDAGKPGGDRGPSSRPDGRDRVGLKRPKRIVVRKAAQVGATEALFCAALYSIDVLGQTVLLVYPTEAAGQAKNTEQLVPAIEATPRVARHLSGSTRDLKNLKVVFRRAQLIFAWAASPITLKSRPVPRLLRDEIDEYPDGALELSEKRVAAFEGAQILDVSTPTLPGVGIDAAYAASDRRQYWVPCPLPGCGRYQTLVWRRVRWDGGLSASKYDVLRNTWYQCAHCQGRIREHHKPWMLARGRWLPEGMHVDHQGRTAGSAPPSDTWGYHVSGLLSPMPNATWGHLAAGFIEHGGRPAREWWNENLGEVVQAQAERVEVAALKRAAGGYRMGQVPAGVVALTAACDVQQDRAVVEVVGWSPRGERVALVDRRTIGAPASTRLEELERLIRAHAPLARGGEGRGYVALGPSPLAGQTLLVRQWYIDTGHRAQQVYRLALALRGVAAVFPVKGEDGATLRTPWRWSKVPTEAGEVALLLVNTWHWKDELLAQLKAASGEDLRQGKAESEISDLRSARGAGAPMGDGAEVEAVALTAPQFPEDVDEQYLKQLTSEQFVFEPGKGGRKGKWAWRLRPGEVDNHYLDCRIYNLAGADANGVRRLRPLPAALAPTALGATPAAVAAPAAAPQPEQVVPALALRAPLLAARRPRL